MLSGYPCDKNHVIPLRAIYQRKISERIMKGMTLRHLSASKNAINKLNVSDILIGCVNGKDKIRYADMTLYMHNIQ